MLRGHPSKTSDQKLIFWTPFLLQLRLFWRHPPPSSINKHPKTENIFCRSDTSCSPAPPRLTALLHPPHTILVINAIKLSVKIVIDWGTWYGLQSHIPYILFKYVRYVSSRNLICERCTKTATGARAFGAVAPKVWHDLPDSIRSSDSIVSFKKNLKTYL